MYTSSYGNIPLLNGPYSILPPSFNISWQNPNHLPKNSSIPNLFHIPRLFNILAQPAWITSALFSLEYIYQKAAFFTCFLYENLLFKGLKSISKDYKEKTQVGITAPPDLPLSGGFVLFLFFPFNSCLTFLRYLVGVAAHSTMNSDFSISFITSSIF